jgi:hypothetical protein
LTAQTDIDQGQSTKYNQGRCPIDEKYKKIQIVKVKALLFQYTDDKKKVFLNWSSYFTNVFDSYSTSRRGRAKDGINSKYLT